MSGARPQFVLEITLDTSQAMPLVHLAAVVAQLAPGAMVRLNVGNTSPYNWCLPGVYQIQTDWLRPDLYWQFTGSNATRLAEWQRVISEIRGVN